jgi:hypothetical protein
MRSIWPSRKARDGDPARTYESTTLVESRIRPGVRYTVLKMSFSRRMELMRRVRELAKRTEYLAASGDTGERMDGALLRAEIDRTYVQWGVRAVAGLSIDGHAATPELLAESGPEDLFREALAAVRRETGLSEDERKNS